MTTTTITKRIALFALLFIAQLSFAQVFNMTYADGITKEKALANSRFYEEDIAKYDYTFEKSNVISPENYEIYWSKPDKKGGLLKVRMGYHFEEKGMKIEIINALYSTNGKVIAITQNDPLPAVKNVYDANKNLFVDVFMKYINLNE